MGQVSVVMQFPVPVEDVWRRLRDFAGIIKWYPELAELKLIGSGVGARRTLTDREGRRQVERLESLDEAARTLTYSVLETTLPLEGCIARLWARESGPGRAEVEWSATFGAKGAPEREVAALLEQQFRRNLARLARQLST
jgi:hypothetical protein